KLDEPQWHDAEAAGDFIQYEPYNAAQPSQPTVVKIIYDDRAIYIGAMMYDSHPDSIYRELGERDDDDINADFFSVDIVPYNDGLNAFEFKVSASGVEIDTKYAANYHDRNWDPIWKSAVEINDSGWVAEIEIPYAAIRFPKTKEQVWGINMWRSIRRHREWSTWNYIDNTMDGVFNQSGTLTGIRDIKPPLRLFFIPYVAGYTEKIPEVENWGYSFNYGLDMKLGLSESFTLDLTLIPDFGQVQSDDEIVNLSPFEIYYQERRPFFTEGTELFERGGIFYTRRVGGTPEGYDDIEDNYSPDNITENPAEIQLLNASKISGRNRNGTAIGVFNAITSNSHARVIDSTGAEQKILTNPATNYNMLVIDQNLRNNSYVSLYNTNVYSGRDNYISNVSGTEFELRNKKDMYAVSGLLNVSQKYYPDVKPDFGHAYAIEAGKISGNFRYALSHHTQNDTYDINDMGFNSRNNRFDNELEIEYNIYDPVGIILDMNNEVTFNYDMLYSHKKFVSFDIESQNRTTFSNFFTAGFSWEVRPVESHDYYEPRVDGWMLIRPKRGYAGFFLSPDYRKRFVIDFHSGYWAATEYGQSGINVSVKPRLRVNDRFSLVLEMEYDNDRNTIGHPYDAPANNDTIIIGKRDISVIENVLDVKYIFAKNISLTLRARYYWFSIKYNEFFKLKEDGYLEASNYSGEHDGMAGVFNIDMVFRWTFAPASELIFVWKNNIDAEQSEIINDYFEDLRFTFNSPMANSFSLKVLYYLDYQSLKKKNRKKSM
ncbi:MAG: carbohydrate binding family 9 domain-containing protein, partial [Bacteroidetes bacterium]|nr:carbohydrate binding family 9 domain-containing protein [Bacteroidota bacterium]